MEYFGFVISQQDSHLTQIETVVGANAFLQIKLWSTSRDYNQSLQQTTLLVDLYKLSASINFYRGICFGGSCTPTAQLKGRVFHQQLAHSSSSSPSSYSHFYVGSMYDDFRLHVAPSYTSSADSPFSLMSSFTLSNHLPLGLPLFLLTCTFKVSLPLPSFQRSFPLFASHARTTSTFFPILSL